MSPYLEEEDLKRTIDTMRSQIGFSTFACIAAHDLTYGQWYGPRYAALYIKTRNCGSHTRRVYVKYDMALDLYDVEGRDIFRTLEERKRVREMSLKNPQRYRMVWERQQVFFDELADAVLEAADFKEE